MATRVKNIKDIIEVFQKLAAQSAAPRAGSWNLSQVMQHCAQSIEYSLKGFPVNRGILFQLVIGKLFLFKTLMSEQMKHPLAAAIPGAPALTETADVQESLTRLTAAIDNFVKCTEPLAPHFAFGSLSKEQYEKIHLYHMNDHLSDFGA